MSQPWAAGSSADLLFHAASATLLGVSFVRTFNELPLDELQERSLTASDAEARSCIRAGKWSLADFGLLISTAAGAHLEELCQRSQEITRRRFGNVIRLFAPLYLSNECINNCQYCGFSRDNPILREHPKFVSEQYLADCVRAMRAEIPGISLEVGPMETAQYRPIVQAGAEGLVV